MFFVVIVEAALKGRVYLVLRLFVFRGPSERAWELAPHVASVVGIRPDGVGIFRIGAAVDATAVPHGRAVCLTVGQEEP